MKAQSAIREIRATEFRIDFRILKGVPKINFQNTKRIGVRMDPAQTPKSAAKDADGTISLGIC
jgi:hypothetical protein